MCYLYSLLFFLLMSSFWAFKIPMLFTSLHKKNYIIENQFFYNKNKVYLRFFLTILLKKVVL